MKSLTLIITFSLIFTSSLLSQNDRFSKKEIPVITENNPAYVKDVPAELQNTDYKVISSGTSFIELEFYPVFIKPSVVRFNGEEFKVIDFENSNGKGVESAGAPDLRTRMFPVILPSENNNTVVVVDYDAKELSGIVLAPVPNVKFTDPMKNRFDQVDYTYAKNIKEYSRSGFQPSEIAYLDKPGIVRELTLASLVIHPYQYDASAGILRQYTRIRVRINFGQGPVLLNRMRSAAEYEFLKGMAINSDVAVNWSSPGLNNSNQRNIIQSVMRDGDWYRVDIKDGDGKSGDGNSEGIYKITKQSLEAAGINLSSVDPRNIKMYGNGGRLLSENPNDPRPADVEPIAIYIEGENDGKFDNNDYILFYGASINNWSYNYTLGHESHFTNYYSGFNYYWIQINGSATPKRMQLVPSENISNPTNLNSFSDHAFYEPEKRNLILEGNLWLSEMKTNGGVFTWSTNLFGLEPNSDIKYRIKPASRVFEGYDNYFLLKDENSNMAEFHHQMQAVASTGFGDWIYTNNGEFIINANQKSSNEARFTAKFYSSQPDGEGYIDWMEIHWKRMLNSAQNDFIKIIPPRDQAGTLQYNVSPFSSNQIRVFNTTEHANVNMIQPIETGSNSVRFQVTQVIGDLKYFMVTGPNGYKTPTAISSKIPNQNIHGYSEGADVEIIVHKDMKAAAEKLKLRREKPDPTNPAYFKVHITTIDEIMNEFGGGVYDASAIRDYLKYIYNNWERKPVYCVLMGDGSLDYKGIINGNNFVPVFERTDPNINQVNGYTSDDYFVIFNGYIGVDKPDMAVGRIPGQSLEECLTYLDKLEAYENPVNNGYWKNKSSFVADDGKTTSGNDGSQHTDQSELLAEQNFPSIIEKNKLYLIAYPTVITSQGRRKPQCNADIIKNWNSGTITLNYTGHGSPEVWAHEYVFEIDVALSQLHNVNKYPMVTVASCDFSKFDNPITQSGGEKLILVPNKGAIVTVAATRPVYGGANSAFNNRFHSELLMVRDTMLLQRTFGRAMFNTKQVYSYVNDIKFVLLGDPTARVQVPRYHSRIDSMSGLVNDTMRALSRIKIYGSVIHPDSSFWSDYNGKIFLKLFDVKRDVILKDEDNFEYRFSLNGGIIYSGTSSVSNGLWTVDFIVPKDISYQNRNGKLINYFYNEQSDGQGEDSRFIVGGIDPNAPIDSAGPNIKLFVNNRNFRSGDVVNSSFKLIGDLFDESGINTTGTIGHKIEAVLDNDENKKYDLTTFYNSDSTYKSGTVEYDFSGITEGKHTLRLRAWDTYNNPSVASIDFNISDYNGLQVTNIYNYPNPFKDNTTFTFMHNFPDLVNVKIKVYTVSGRLIKEITRNDIADKFVAIDWTGKDEDGETLGNGVYIYKLTVDAKDGSSFSSTGKIAVLK